MIKKAILFITAITLMAFSLKETRPITVFLIGDSTVADKPYRISNPEKGWGQVLPLYFDENVRVENYALNGRSTKSFIDEGHWEKVKSKIQSGDYVIIEFGHNDQKEDSPDRYADPDIEYPRLLSKYIAETRERGGIPILASPIARRKFDERGYLLDTHGKYPDAVRQVALKEGVLFFDMHNKSKDLLLEFGPERSKQLFLHLMPGEYDNLPKGAVDDTHLSGTGAFKICDLAIEEIKKKVPSLSKYLKE
ncbi:MAG TPA: rhamnogalacturonan acetylesterase [Sphingobacteriaceae bacterium]|nr:rhamnogalacturonan acetylesterase [Sphingobacteriaceae bacterium]